MRALIFDPFSGISGDMTIAALLDLGLPLAWLQDFARRLALGPIEVGAERVQRCGIACTRLRLTLPPEPAHRHLRDVLAIVERADVPGEVRDRAAEAFTRLAEDEAEVHGTTPERVHFHEVGALDALFDVLGALAGVRELGFVEAYTRPVTLGRGWVQMEHGTYPVPPPAVLKLLRDMPVRDPEFEGECTTPTGAILLRVLTGGRAAPATFTPLATGFGAGARDPQDRPNCLRLLAVELERTADELLLLQSDVDDLPPEYVPALLDELLRAGALDATATPLLMKKGRPGVRVEALLPPAARAAVEAAFFQASPTLGVRGWAVQREALPRQDETVEWRGQSIRLKRSQLPGGGERVKPEYQDVARAAASLGVPAYAVFRALLDAGLARER